MPPNSQPILPNSQPIPPTSRSSRNVQRLNYHLANNPPLQLFLTDSNALPNTNTTISDVPSSENANATENYTPSDSQAPNSSTNFTDDSNIDPDLVQDNSDADNQSLQLFDSISQSVSRFSKRRRVPKPQSWVYTYFETQDLDSKTYTPKYSNIPKPEKHYRCKKCNWSVLESQREGTSNFIGHLQKQHSISKNSIAKPGPTITEMFNNAPPLYKTSPEDSIINWVIDTVAPFTCVEHKSFQKMFEAHSAKYAIRNADTIHDCIMDRYIIT